MAADRVIRWTTAVVVISVVAALSAHGCARGNRAQRLRAYLAALDDT
jgi:hypothetical protein